MNEEEKRVCREYEIYFEVNSEEVSFIYCTQI